MENTKYEGYNWLQIQRQRQVLKKQEMIDAIRALLDANEKNPHCDEHWLADLIREELE